MSAPIPDLSHPTPPRRVLLSRGVDQSSQLQDRNYGHDRCAVLLVHKTLAAAAGPGGTLQHVMYGLPPRRCQVVSFKAPSAEELDHDFLWRSLRALPPQGRTGVFTRSYYEDVLVVKMCPEVLAAAKVPGSLVGKHVWDERYEDIRAVEGHLARSGTAIRRFFHPVASGAQRRRFLERLNSPETRWPFDLGDLETRDRWENYMRAYEEAIHETLADAEPGAVVPPDERWFTRLVVAAVVVHALQSLGQRSCAGRATLAGPREA